LAALGPANRRADEPRQDRGLNTTECRAIPWTNLHCPSDDGCKGRAIGAGQREGDSSAMFIDFYSNQIIGWESEEVPK